MKLPWMSRADRRRWRSARTLADIGELTAQWLEGKIASQPGYQPNTDPDEETVETGEVIPALAACNRAGFVTTSSQPGCIEDDKHGLWEQKAAVEGFVSDASLLERLLGMADHLGYQAVVHHGPKPGPNPKGIVATTVDGQPHTGFGRHLTRRWLRTLYPATIIHRAAFAELHEAWQVTLVASWYGSSRLFFELRQLVTAAPCGCGCMKYGVSCGDGCDGMTADDDRCQACIDPSVSINWSQVHDDEPNECALCGAPFYASRRYCSTDCEIADQLVQG